MRSFAFITAICIPALGTGSFAARAHPTAVAVVVTPAAAGRQLVRIAMPLPFSLVRDGQTLEAFDGKRKTTAALRVLTWHPELGAGPRSARRAFVTFPYTFADTRPVRFSLRPIMQ